MFYAVSLANIVQCIIQLRLGAKICAQMVNSATSTALAPGASITDRVRQDLRAFRK